MRDDDDFADGADTPVTDGYEVGYGKPPRQHRFSSANQPARKKGAKPIKVEKAINLSDTIGTALDRKMKVKRGGKTISLRAGEIMVEHLVQAMVSGSPRDRMKVFEMIAKHAPDRLSTTVADFKVVYQRAAASDVALPPASLYDDE